jgi:FkbM family methyltransferase
MAINAALKSLAKRFNLYNKLRYSDFYFWLLRCKNPGYIRALNDDLEFYRKALRSSLELVFDIGANIGDKAWVFRQIAKRVVCVEPDRSSFAALRARYGRDKSISLENVALGGEEGQAKLYVEADGSCYNTLSEKQRNWLLSRQPDEKLNEYSVPVSTLDSLISKYGVPDYVKIDVEGYELTVLNGLSHRVPLISFEANLPHFRQETLRIIERFAHAGAPQFNLRLRDRFVFPSHVDRARVEDAVCRDEEVSYDVFVYNVV